jgi:hypothetical protein
VAGLVFAVALGAHFRGLWGHDPREVVLANAPADPRTQDGWARLAANDLRFTVALTARNARTLATRPLRIFELEQCHPTRKALALGEPMIAAGLAGIPAYLASGDPLVTFTFVLLALTLLAAGAMYALLHAWTGVPAAGIVAGLLYAFHPIKTHDLVHFYAWDGAWTALALLFATRLFVAPRWRDALGLSAVCAAQMGGSIYPLLAAAVLALPFLAWLVIAHGPLPRRLAPWALVVGCVAVSAWALLGPYLALRTEGQLETRVFQAFFAWAWLAPGEQFFPGLALPVLAAVAILAPRRARAPGRFGDPRWALLLGAVLCMLLATGGTAGDIWRAWSRGETPPPALPNLWAPLVAVVPGLDVIRAPAALFSGVHLALAALAGLGTAALARLVPRRHGPWLGAGLVLAAGVAVLRAPLGIAEGVQYEVVPLRPPSATLAFFERLAELGDRGPILEVGYAEENVAAEAASLLLSAYHRRATSACFNSFRGAAHETLRSLRLAPPSDASVAQARALGFTTVLLHHPGRGEASAALRRAFDEYAATGAGLARVHGIGAMTAYAIAPAAPTAGAPAGR